tara:strand:- start:272 stop:718 length:447 start_codon:yes stop_codon:yes gene_type:complete
MALEGKKSGNMHNLTGSKKARLQAKFDEDFHDVVALDPESNPILASILYTLQNVTEDIDSLRTYTDSELKGLISTNTDKTNFPGIGTTSSTCKAGDTTTISTAQATLLTYLAKGVTNSTGYGMKFTLNEEGALVITVNRSTYTIAADR